MQNFMHQMSNIPGLTQQVTFPAGCQNSSKYFLKNLILKLGVLLESGPQWAKYNATASPTADCSTPTRPPTTSTS